MVIGKSYKENLILVWVMYIFLLIMFVGVIVCSSIFVDKLLLKIILISLASILLILFSYIPYYVYKYKKTPENIIIYNDMDETITINGYKRNHLIKISDIVAITIHNIGTKVLFSNRIKEGKLYFYLNDGSKIKTVELDDVYNTYYKLDEIVFVDREYQNEVKDQLIDKLDGWGAKKEYPAIVSLLISLFIPFFGLWFVSNQKKFKELKYGKSTGIMALSLIISALWVIAIIVVLYFL